MQTSATPQTTLTEPSWLAALETEFQAPYMQDLRRFLQQEKKARKVIYPKSEAVFTALNMTPLDKVKVVILGQDPYHGPNQAHGLCFSVQPGVRIPPSLRNIYQELESDLGIKPVQHGCLLAWAKQGVLLLNSVLTVENGQAASHQGKGWEQFTDKIISLVNAGDNPVMFVLWGAYAQKKGAVIDTKRHGVIKSVHPSPLSVHRGFFGTKPFSRINAFLTKHGRTPIDWQLPEQQSSVIY